MSDKRTFIDSNVLLYLYTDDERRKKIVLSLLASEYSISTQVVSENVNVCLKKLKLSREEAYAHGKNLLNTFNVVHVYSTTISLAFDLSIKCGFSYWDSLIVATAIESNCEILLTEDMSNGQVIEGKLLIINPFLPEIKK